MCLEICSNFPRLITLCENFTLFWSCSPDCISVILNSIRIAHIIMFMQCKYTQENRKKTRKDQRKASKREREREREREGRERWERNTYAEINIPVRRSSLSEFIIVSPLHIQCIICLIHSDTLKYLFVSM